MSVPNTNTFGLDTVRSELGLSYPSSLSACFAASVDANFDPVYKGSKDRLSNFRNYTNALNAGFVGTNVGHIVADSSVSWDAVHEAMYGTLVTSDPVKVIVQQTSAPLWVISRGFCEFDLTSLAGRTIISAKFYWGVRAINPGGSSLVVRRGTQSTPLHYSNFDNITTDVIISSTTAVYQGACGSNNLYYVYGEADSGNLSVISSYFGSTLKVVILEFNDHANYEPGSFGEFWSDLFFGGECLVGCRCSPYLHITYI